MTIDLTAATEAAARVRLAQYSSEYSSDHLDLDDFTEESREVLAAAMPHIEAALREQIAEEIQAMYPEMSHHVLITERRQALYDGMREAAQIARGEAGK